MNWNIIQNGFQTADIADNGNRFLTGNGYMGVRGTLEEFGKEQLAAVNLAGIYHRVGDGWQEPLNAPNPFHTYLTVSGVRLAMPELPPHRHKQSLCFRDGVMRRHTVWRLGDGVEVTLECQRFVHLAQPHLLALRCKVTASADITLILHAGIDGDVWDIHGPHYGAIECRQQDETLLCLATTRGETDQVAVGRRNFGSFSRGEISYESGSLSCAERFRFSLVKDTPVTVTSLCSVFTTRDPGDPLDEASAALADTSPETFDAWLAESATEWQRVWQSSLVEIDGDEEAETAVNYSLYHLNCAAPRHGQALSIPARGLSGQTYKGAVFWDSEIFMLDYFLYCQPKIAESMVRYRIETLDGALQKAAEYGYEGAFYAWESQQGGYDGCSDYNVTDVFTGRPVRTYFRDKQIHISAAVVWTIMHTVRVTGDRALLRQGGARVILECARFYRSRLVRPVPKERYELHDVVGADEYHERVNNNAYTSRMAAYCFESALAVAEDLDEADRTVLAGQVGDLETLLTEIRDALAHLYIPAPGKDGVIEQFDGYFTLEDATVDEVKSRLKDPREYWGGGHGVASDTQVIKQADVVAMLELFHTDYNADVLQANWRYYEPRTEHGSSLSACMYALLACRFGEPDLAYPFFMKSATAEIRGGGKQWAGLVYIGGTHPAAAGGAWKVLAEGFAGLDIQDGSPVLSADLPAQWRKLRFRFTHGGKLRRVTFSQDGLTVEILSAPWFIAL